MCWAVDGCAFGATFVSGDLSVARASVRTDARVSRRHRNATLLCLWMAVFSVVSGCGRPQGVLFPTIDPPRVWPPQPDTPRIRLVGVLADSGDLAASRSGVEAIKAAFRGPRPPIRFRGPHGVAVRDSRFVAVADASGSAVHVIDLDRREHVMATGFGDQRFMAPVGVSWAGDRLFVTDAQRHEVVELDGDGKMRRRFGADVLERPVGIAYVPALERLCVVDGGQHRLTLFDLSGNVTGTIGRRGAGPGEFNFPTHVCCRGDRLLVSDSGNFRVQLLDLDGTCLQTIGQKGDGAGDLSLPKGVAFDGDGHIYVVDAHFENIQLFDQDGRLLMALGQEGSEPGRFSLPVGLAIDGRDRIWVAESGNRRLQVFEYMRTSS